jgi:hypothetical protein
MKKTLPVNVILGNPRVDCARLGICSLDGTDEQTPGLPNGFPAAKNHRFVKAWLSTTPEGHLEMLFPTEQMMPLTRKMFFSKSVFTVEVDKTIPEHLCKALGVAPGTAFMAGKWPLTLLAEGYLTVIETSVEAELTLAMALCGC